MDGRIIMGRMTAGAPVIGAGRAARAMAAIAALALASGCDRQAREVGAEPLPQPPYGEEEDADFDLWLDKLEVSSRELYASREAVLAALKLDAGARVADIGAGTGIYSLLMSSVIGDDGVVYAVDIEPRFLTIVVQRVADLDLENVVAILSREDDVTLPPQSVDVAFIADTYHYFADPEALMLSVRQALTPGGRLYLVDYEFDARAAGDPSRDHIRFGKDQLIDEIVGFGFEFRREPEVEGLSEFFLLEFELPAEEEVTG
ncbi:MAG: methyltransferase domain-containing protein [Pseudomonadota bacterium]